MTNEELYQAIQDFKKFIQDNFPFKQTTFSGTEDPSDAGLALPERTFFIQVDGSGAVTQIYYKQGSGDYDWHRFGDVLSGDLSSSTGAEMVGYGAETVASKLLELANSVTSGLTGGAPMWGSIGEGLDNTAVDQFFTVPGTGDDYSILYRHDPGDVAFEVARSPSAGAVRSLGDQINGAVARSEYQPNLFTREMLELSSAPDIVINGSAAAATFDGAPAIRMDAAGGVMDIRWVYPVDDFPSGKVSFGATLVDMAAGVTGMRLSVLFRDSGGNLVSPFRVDADQVGLGRRTHAGEEIPAAAATIEFAVEQLPDDAEAGDHITITAPFIADGSNDGYRLPAPPPAPTLSWWPYPDFDPAEADPFAGTVVVEDDEFVLDMSAPDATTTVSTYRIPVQPSSGIVAGATITARTEVFTDAIDGADITLYAYDSGGTDIGNSLPPSYAKTTNDWTALTAKLELPAGTASVGLRFVKRGNVGSTIGKFRRVALVSDSAQATTINMTAKGSAPSTGAVVVYVSPTGSDSGEGSQSQPYATFARALQDVKRGGTIMIVGGEYRQEMSLSGIEGHVEIRAMPYERALIFGSDQLSLTKTAGYNFIYEAPLASKPTGMGGGRGEPMIFEWGTPSKPIPIEDRHDLQRGEAYRLPYTEMLEAGSLAELDDPGGAGKWWWENGTIYLSATDQSDATLKRYETRMRPCITGGDSGSVKLTRVDAYFSNWDGMAFQGLLSVEREDCRTFGNHRNGFDDSGTIVKSYRDEAGGCGNDGFNGTAGAYESTGNREYTYTGIYIDPYGHDNYDDGISYHIRGENSVIGGLFEHNTKAGVVHVTGASCSNLGTISRYNGNGFYAASVPPDGRTCSFLRTTGCVAYGNDYNYRAGDTAQILAVKCSSRDAGNTGYLASGPTGRIEARNCRHGGTGTATSGDVVVISDAELV